MTDIHVLPINDLREHEESESCWCRPRRDEEEPTVLIHNSADGREHTKEKGKLQ